MTTVLHVADVECIVYPDMFLPMHIYIRVGGKMSVFTLDPKVQCVTHDPTMSPNDLRKAKQLATGRRTFLIKRWKEIQETSLGLNKRWLA